jgi:hypothetical protein
MHDGVDGVLAQNVGNERFVGHVAYDEMRASYGLPKAGRKVIEYDNGFATFGELQNSMAANVAGTAGDED